MFCFDLKGGLLWSRDLGKMETLWDHGECVTPVVYRDTVIVVHDQLGQSVIFALDSRTGETKWMQARNEEAGWSTPLIIDRQGEPQVICAGTNRIRSCDLATGRVVWESGGLGPASVSSPVVAGDLGFFMTYYERPSLLAVKVDSTGDLTGTDKVVWRRDRDTSYVPSALVVDEVLYFLKGNTAILTGVNIYTGETVLPTQRLSGLSGNVFASPVLAGGLIYVTGRGGNTLVIRPGVPVQQIALNELDESFDASPAIVGSRMFLRGKSYLYCIEER
jgi:outer membrane protein assembly factor BamB